MRRIEKAFPPVGDFLTVDGVRLHYKSAGDGQPLVLLHGASGNLRDWTFGPFGEMATTNTVIAFDRPGLGYSERPLGAEDPAVQAKILKRATALVGQGNPIVAGHSYGGAVALAWALLEPNDVSGLLLLAAASHEWPGETSCLYRAVTHPVIGPLAAQVLPRIASSKRINNAISRIFAPQTAPDGYLGHVGAGLAVRPQTVRANASDIAALKPHLVEMEGRYPLLKMPVEILHGTDDVVVPIQIHSDRLAKALPQARYQRLAGTGHMPHHCAQSQMIDALHRLNAQLA